jgi:hypothetical protein
MEDRAHLGRSRWAAIGAAVAVTLGIGGGIAITNAVGEGAPSAFVPITPCRLFDTRADSAVGPRKTPLTAGETFVQQVTGTNGNCTVPAGTQGVAFNVTIVNGTATSFLTVWPSDATKPLASSLNWLAGTPAIPNKVDVRLSTDGKVSFFNNGGTVDVLADIVGYYAGITGAGEPKRVIVDQGAFSTDGVDPLTHDFDDGYAAGNVNPTCGIAQARFPNGVKLTDVTAHVTDANANAGFDVTVRLWRNPVTIEAPELMFSKATPTNTANGNTSLTGTTITSPDIDNNQNSYFVTVCGLSTANRLYEVIFTYA